MRKPVSRETIFLFGIPILLILAWMGTRIEREPEPVVIEVSNLKAIRWLAYSPDGKKLAAANDSSVRVYDSATHTRICDLDTTHSSRDESYLSNMWPLWSGDSRRIVSLCDSLAFTRIKVSKPEEHWKKVEEFRRNYIRRFAIWDAQSGALTADYFYGPHPGHSDTELLHPQSMRFTADDKRLIGEKSPAALFDAVNGRRLKIFDIKVPKYELVYYNDDLGLLAIMGDQGRNFQVVNAKTKQVVWKRDDISIQSMKWQKNMLCVVLTNQGSNNKLLLWDGKTRKELPEPPVKFEMIPQNMYTLLNDDVMVFSTVEAKLSRTRQPYWYYEVVAWNYRQNRVLWRTETEHFMNHLQVSPDGKLISAIAYRGFDALGFIIFNADGKIRSEHPSTSELYAWSPDNHHLATVIQTENSYQSNQSTRIEILSVGR